MNVQDRIAQIVSMNKEYLGRYLKKFDDSNHTKQSPGLPNHVAWSLGHCAMTMHRVAGVIDGRGLPSDAFIDGSDRGDANRFGTESIAYGSTPTDEPARYPGFARCREIYDRSCDRLASAVHALPESRLDEMVKWGTGETPLGLLCIRMSFHNGMHTGQIADLRRALGMGSILS
ncbi:MAG TPA: DinB family protein [Phycisphaerales bacterium]|nr:DinB family protein [Phycisphaerales bacterium]